jgi:hypothetical protein
MCVFEGMTYVDMIWVENVIYVENAIGSIT